MVSPFRDDLGIDIGSVEKLTEHLASNQCTPFVLGTTGEAASMSAEQKMTLVESAVRAVKGKSPVFAGISSNSLKTSVELAKQYADLGIEAAVATPPCYYPVEDDYLLHYFDELAGRIPVPLILYNMPLTTGISIPLEVADTLSHHPNIAGIKDSERDTRRLDSSLQLWSERKDFGFLLGWAPMSVYALKNGADGIVPSTANLYPDLYHSLYQAVLNGQLERAEALQLKTDRISSLYQKNRKLNRSLPALKVLLSIHNLCGPQVLPPLYRMEEKEENSYYQEMKSELQKLMNQ